VRTIETSFTGHHRKPIMIQMKTSNGSIAETDQANANILAEHFNGIFNAEPPTVNIQTVLEKIEQRPVRNDLAASDDEGARGAGQKG
jgi:hypothetical protein